MGQRTYNILFHTHTVSGIIISVALYIIFFAGSFSFFRDEIANWQYGQTVKVLDEIPDDINSVVMDMGSEHKLFSRDITIAHYYNEPKINVSIGASKDTLVLEEDRQGSFYYLDTKNGQHSNYNESYSLGEFLYRLHFFDQLPYPYGRYLAGLVAFFFLFAIFTGIAIHWNKIISNFYLFRPRGKLKTLWTDSHTALGVIGLPFQLVYAVTGAFFLLKFILIAPSVMGLYEGDQNKLYEDLEYVQPVFEFMNRPIQTEFDLNSYIVKTKEYWPAFKVTKVQIFNYGDVNMHLSITGNLDYRSKFNGIGNVIFKVADNSIVHFKNPLKSSSYLDGVKNVLFRLHLGDYAGLGLRVVSFVLGLISCFVIISGIMIWLVARNKKNIPQKKRHFNENVVRYFLAICLSMYPITALEFILVKIFQPNEGKAFFYSTYFIGWLILTIFLIIKNNNGFTNRSTLLLGSALGLLVPITNGFVTGKWIWNSYAEGLSQILFIDVLWLILSLIGFWVAFQLNRNQNSKVLSTTKRITE
ncbi:PepSY-associated TM helix domain-containing protein [Arenibacter sp. S6351L]|uniref:PepSY-associated TM helix domain-containing protein n=1 Tax=Arenibacter sp. S6351L TaxID=2926407 RepID=UPI001FF20BAE|nr:PepSY-associated TM helix domain-containing protein [Arenibacter sp. S6351L]MCK0136060.1 PepSY domain-containing protein [Arenibacter sp. S6351L]